MGLLIDSTLLIWAERNRLAPARLLADLLRRRGDTEVAISVISAGELLHGCWRADSPARRARREEFVDEVFSVVPVIAITLPIIRVFAEVDASLRAAGSRLPTSDLLIGCTALSRGDEVVTGNVRHLGWIPGLVVYDQT